MNAKDGKPHFSRGVIDFTLSGHNPPPLPLRVGVLIKPPAYNRVKQGSSICCQHSQLMRTCKGLSSMENCERCDHNFTPTFIVKMPRLVLKAELVRTCTMKTYSVSSSYQEVKNMSKPVKVPGGY